MEIMWKNINEDKWHNFNKYDNTVVNSHDVPYDFMSTLHYDDWAFSNNTNVTIRTHDKNAQGVARWNKVTGFRGGSGGPRLTDIELVRRMYNCDELDLTKVNLPDYEKSECYYFYGNGKIPEASLIISLANSDRIVFAATTMAESWHNCLKLCYDNPECTEWTINYSNGACNVGKSLLQKVV